MKGCCSILLAVLLASAAPGQTALSLQKDSLTAALKLAKTDTDSANVLNSLCELLGKKGEYEKGSEAADKAVAMLERKRGHLLKNEAEVLAQSYVYSADMLYKRGRNPEAMGRAKKALELYEQLSDRAGIALAYNNIAVSYDNQSDFPHALEYYFKALKIREALHDKAGIAALLGNIGEVYRQLPDRIRALEYYQRSLDAIEQTPGSSDDKNIVLGNALNNIGLIYDDQKEYAKALDYLERALAIRKKMNDKKRIGGSYNNIGILYKKRGDYDKALECYLQAYGIKKDIGDHRGMSIALVNISEVYMIQKKFPQAEEMLTQSLALAREAGALQLVQEVYQALYELHQQSGRYDKAFAEFKQFVALRDSITNENNIKRQTELEMQYQFDRKETADSIKNAEQRKQEQIRHNQEISQQKTYTYGGVAGFVLMLVITGISFRAYRQKHKANEIISEQKQLVEAKQKEILDSIYYAKRIQNNILPTRKYIERKLNELRKV